MNEIEIVFDLQSPQEKNTGIRISIAEKPQSNLLYKFMSGADGTWEVLRDFSELDSVEWIPKTEGQYVIMVQAKQIDSNRPFDYVSRSTYTVGKKEDKLIKDIYIDKSRLTVGDKLNLSVEANKLPVVYRYWIKKNDNWELIKDYSAENALSLSVKETGEHEILVECKTLDSKNKFDDFKKIKFQADPIKKIEITDFKALVSDMLVEKELIFQVETAHEDNRMVLYKFIKINPDGTISCIQDYSTKRTVSFAEQQHGDYKLLCLAKDMYSQKEYDDRALLSYKVKLYKTIEIQSFTSDLNSPQVCGTMINLKAVVSGGKELLYRFIIDGNNGEDSGYIRSSTYTWSTKKPGEYKISLWVKDISFEGSCEDKSELYFLIEEQYDEPVVINEVILDRSSRLLKGETINVKAIAAGGKDLRYSFIIRKDGKEVEKIDYGTCNWANYTPEEKGIFELEVRVKDKYSAREFDSHSIGYIEAYDYLPAEIDHILSPLKENHIVGDTITYQVIVQNTKKTLLKYAISINGHKVEETDFEKDKKYAFTPKRSGIYTLEIYARSEDSDKEFDVKKDVRVKVSDAVPITNTKIHCENEKILVNEAATFIVSCDGGKEVLYEFYLMEKGDWLLVQKYSRKNYYSFIPFSKATYRILALCRSSLKKGAYEDYDIFEFTIE